MNDHHGHHMGDTVLRLVAQRLASVVRADDTLARLGGDEFTVLMRGNPSAQGLVRLIDSIMETFAAPFVLPSGVPVTLGVTPVVHQVYPAKA